MYQSPTLVSLCHPPTNCHFSHLVAQRLKQEGRKEIFDQETMEELEDDEGNVYNKKTWEDLKKQGLIWFLFYFDDRIESTPPLALSLRVARTDVTIERQDSQWCGAKY